MKLFAAYLMLLCDKCRSYLYTFYTAAERKGAPTGLRINIHSSTISVNDLQYSELSSFPEPDT